VLFTARYSAVGYTRGYAMASRPSVCQSLSYLWR